MESNKTELSKNSSIQEIAEVIQLWFRDVEIKNTKNEKPIDLLDISYKEAFDNILSKTINDSKVITFKEENEWKKSISKCKYQLEGKPNSVIIPNNEETKVLNDDNKLKIEK